MGGGVPTAAPSAEGARGLVLWTQVAGALFGAFLTHTALGSGRFLVTAGAVIVSAALLSLLLRPEERFRRRSATA